MFLSIGYADSVELDTDKAALPLASYVLSKNIVYADAFR